MEIAAFSQTFEKFGELIIKDEIMLVEGVLNTDRRTGTTRLRIEALHDMESARNVFARRLLLRINKNQTSNGILNHLQDVLVSEDERHCPVFVQYETDESVAQIRLGERCAAPVADDSLKQLQELLGKEHVKMCY